MHPRQAGQRGAGDARQVRHAIPPARPGELRSGSHIEVARHNGRPGITPEQRKALSDTIDKMPRTR